MSIKKSGLCNIWTWLGKYVSPEVFLCIGANTTAITTISDFIYASETNYLKKTMQAEFLVRLGSSLDIDVTWRAESIFLGKMKELMQDN